MNRVLKSLLDDYVRTNEYESIEEYLKFEYFAIYCVLSKLYDRQLIIEDVHTGGGNDTGIDGIGIIVNNLIIENEEDLIFLIEKNASLDVQLIFIQAKNSSHFDSGEMLKFGSGVSDFLSESPSLVRNEIIEHKSLIYNLLVENSKYIKHIHCKLYYVTHGKSVSDKNILSAAKKTRKDIVSTNLFSTVEYNLVNEEALITHYRDSLKSIEATFEFKDLVILPELPNISQSYSGFLPLKEFKKLIADKEGNLLDIYDDNVRDFQGFTNPINELINQTLNSEHPELFSVLNNGVTIVASRLNVMGFKYTIFDYQIVNGCQTSNVLGSHINNPALDNLLVPIKLIVTEDEDLKKQITIATNSQTKINREQLQAMKDFHKTLEQYYGTYPVENRMYYERRTKQYQSYQDVPRSRIISIQNQIKSFGSMYFEIPHEVNTYFGRVLDSYVEREPPRIFSPDHDPITYYTSALAFYRLDYLFKHRLIDTKYRKIKWHILTVFSKIANSKYPNGLKEGDLKNEKKAREYCDPIIELLNDEKKSEGIFGRVIEIIDNSGVDVFDKQALKYKNFTDQILLEVFKKLKGNK